MLHITEEQLYLPACRWGNWATSRLEKRITSILLHSYLGFVSTFFFFLWDWVNQGLKIHEEFRKYCWRGDWNHIHPGSELSQKDFGLWSNASDTHYDSHLLLYLCYLCLLILPIFQNDSFCQRDKWVSRWAPEQRNFLFSVLQAHQTK